MIGIEFVKDDRLTPAAVEAAAVKDRCLKSGLIVGLGGTFGNVLRFQPPLVITREQIDRAIQIFSGALEP